MEENEAKEDARALRILRVRAVAGARRNSLSLRQSARYIPSTAQMLGAGQWEKPKAKATKQY